MKTQKGVTMMSLVIYVASFMMITGIIGYITTYFYNNMKIMDTSIGSSAEYNKFNLYMSKIVKEKNCKINKFDKYYITFETDEGKNTFVKPEDNDILYYNKTKLCSNVEKFEIQVDDSTGKKVIKVLLQISGTAFGTQYVISN